MQCLDVTIYEPVTDAVEVTVTDKSSSTAYKATTVNGTATFQLVAGIYEASATVYKESSIFNGTNPAVTVVDNGTNSFRLELSESTTSQVIIKELYFAGCMDNEDAKDYALDKYVILYNNSPVEADASKFAFAIGNPANANATNNYLKDGKLTYSDYIPAWTACWWFDTNVRIAPYSQIVISITGAINHTETYRNSVDLSKADYVFYDPEVFNNVSYYPAPSASIPASNYLKTYCYGLGTAWAISKTSPAFFIFSPEGTSAKDFVTNPENIESPTGKPAFNCAKIPVKWIKDGVEVFDNANLQKSNKRLLDSVDAGYICFTGKKGFTVYRNVDKEATEALAENEGKLVYNYAGGTEAEEGGSTDPSGIDAEASIAKGAHIIYKDTNNSKNDFHQRKVSSIKK